MTSITQNSGLNREYSGQHIDANDPVKYTNEHSPYQNSAETYNADAQRQVNNTEGGFIAGATETLANAGETAKQYLPASVVNTLQNVGVMSHDTSVTSTTLPSQETQFAGSRGGVGTLPGTRSETEVAKLPDEKKYEEEVGRPLGREGVMGTQAEERQTVGLADPFLLEPYQPRTESRRVNPTAGTNTAAKFINLDAIPTPDPETPGRERTLHGIPDQRSPEHKTEPTPLNNGPTGMQERDKSVNKLLPAPGENTHAPATSGIDKKKNDTSYSKDQANKQAPKTEPPHAEPSSAKPSPADHKAHDEQKPSTEDSHITDKSEKPSLAQKIKGEVKVISGKLSNNPAKVEAGQALKKGTA